MKRKPARPMHKSPMQYRSLTHYWMDRGRFPRRWGHVTSEVDTGEHILTDDGKILTEDDGTQIIK